MLRIHHWQSNIKNILGPGNRAVVWVQGCNLACKGCISPEMWPSEGGQLIDPDDLLAQIIASGPVDGITISGGEPTQQAGAISKLLYDAQQAGLNTWVYSGYTIEQLVQMKHPDVDRLMSLCDVIVDGRYEEDLAGSYLWRGSSNQRMIMLTDRIKFEEDDFAKSRIEISLKDNGEMLIIGVPPKNFLNEFRDRLAAKGLHLHFLGGKAYAD
jgi:anaerobic ribonucleoside-triphosphate reductase activating protein